MIIIGVTGGIGSGKSIVCKFMSIHNIPVYDADKEAKNLNDNSSIIKSKLIERFGNNIYTNEVLNKKKLANLIFNDKDNLQYVNSVIHSELATHFLNWIEKNKHCNLLAIDAAVLFESGFDKYVDKIVTVIAPIDIRIARVSDRDNLSSEQIKARIESQISDKERIEKSDFMITNDNKSSIIKQVNYIINKITQTAL